MAFASSPWAEDVATHKNAAKTVATGRCFITRLWIRKRKERTQMSYIDAHQSQIALRMSADSRYRVPILKWQKRKNGHGDLNVVDGQDIRSAIP